MRDKSFTAMWTTNSSAGEVSNINAMELGIKKKASDPNLDGFDIDGKTGKIHSENWDLWIQSGATDKSGFFVSIGEMNSEILGIRKLDVSSYAAASDANDKVEKAIQKIAGQRTLIGVQQNRLEYASKIDDNTSENTQYAESRIRDTDMAKEMVNYSKHNIIEQAGQNMLAQANQSTQGVMSLLG
ncbi:MAG: hypothetical protein K5929_00320 [Lachnospiraceae bacterium]|nr:hypothetical protein [Lachnospiraceae bacterium]